MKKLFKKLPYVVIWKKYWRQPITEIEKSGFIKYIYGTLFSENTIFVCGEIQRSILFPFNRQK